MNLLCNTSKVLGKFILDVRHTKEDAAQCKAWFLKSGQNNRRCCFSRIIIAASFRVTKKYGTVSGFYRKTSKSVPPHLLQQQLKLLGSIPKIVCQLPT